MKESAKPLFDVIARLTLCERALLQFVKVRVFQRISITIISLAVNHFATVKKRSRMRLEVAWGHVTEKLSVLAFKVTKFQSDTMC